MAAIIRILYAAVVRPLLFRRDPEQVHEAALAFGEALGARRGAAFLISKCLRHDEEILRQNIFGLDFPNPVGLAAGFDKNGRLPSILASVGFGFEEVGSITNEPCGGNPKPRLSRLPKSRGIVVNYGLANEGADSVLARLAARRKTLLLGVSVAKTNSPKTVERDAGIADYAACFRKVALSNVGDYIAVNISCPNAFGGEPFTNASDLEELLRALGKIPNRKPVLIKMPPDLGEEEFGALLSVCKRYRVDGIIIANLTKDRRDAVINQEEIAQAIPSGGVSGRPTFKKSNALIRFAYRNFGRDFTIVGCGGIFSAEDAYEKIRLGASLVELITGMIFEGPQLIGEIARGLGTFLKRDGFKNVREAVGVDAA